MMLRGDHRIEYAHVGEDKKVLPKKKYSRIGNRKYIKIDCRIDFLIRSDEIAEVNWRITQSISGAEEEKTKKLWEE